MFTSFTSLKLGLIQINAIKCNNLIILKNFCRCLGFFSKILLYK
ncbi:hypothetical protein NEICINOT_03350 [Neisseria cinerea ATCC 14685]|uniref:Uncharacterized protein n=1 Tax=Neisseria cinerea ATCC 14685 TaxID=546262 RepID=D0W131_NEICI|nr:hypothetical protein NEICINOT_03350 [Neisseria cinerea ATCC 14685]